MYFHITRTRKLHLEVKQIKTTMHPKAIKFKKQMSNRFLFRLGMFFSLPLAWYAKITIAEINEDACHVNLPFIYRTKNPFKSVYFAAQAIAAEMSTGALVMMLTLNTDKKCSMLVTNLQANFHKKTTEKVVFICNDGPVVQAAIKQSLATSQPVKFSLKSVAKLSNGEIASEFIFEWSVKFKS